jgi:DNA modification methylase
VTLFVDDADFQLYVGDVRDCLRELEPESVHCVVTSPPYWGLRDYGTGSWDGGDPDCDHVAPPTGGPQPLARLDAGGGQGMNYRRGNDGQYRDVCGKCGATRADQQIGLEATPELFVASMVAVFREVRRVLRRDGTCWVNLGDSYAGGKTGRTDQGRDIGGRGGNYADGSFALGEQRPVPPGMKQKDLCGIPWRVAFALQADGWYLRSDIVWSKPNPMPESVTDRPTKAHEYVFLLTRSPRYFFDQEAVREDAVRGFAYTPNSPRMPDGGHGKWRGAGDAKRSVLSGDNQTGTVCDPSSGRNIRSVWEIVTQPYPEAHFATFPEALPERCIRAGTSERGCCPVCGAPWERETELTPEYAAGVEYAREKRRSGARAEHADGFTNVNHGSLGGAPRTKQTVTTGWRPSCTCTLSGGVADAAAGGTSGHGRGTPAESVPCTVLDPFMGSGTTALVARKLGRRSVGVELNPDYAALCARRLQQLSLLA